jgi:DNA-binding MarR family transcriptional regulator
LFLGTRQTNAEDMTSKGRSLAGESHNQAKLTEQEVSEIRRLYASGEFTQRVLGDLYGVSISQVGRIVRRVRWS